MSKSEGGLRVSRRVVVATGAAAAIAASVPAFVDDKSAHERVRITRGEEKFPYADILPNVPQRDGRPVRIFVDPSEFSNKAFYPAISLSDAPGLTDRLTIGMKQHQGDYRELFDAEGNRVYQEKARVSSEIVQGVRDAIWPITQLRSDIAEPDVQFFAFTESDPKMRAANSDIAGEADYDHNRVVIQFKPDKQLPVKGLRMVGMHERLHFIQRLLNERSNSTPAYQSFRDAYKRLYDSGVEDWSQYVAYLRENGADAQAISNGLNSHPLNDNPSFKALGPLANLVTEASYLEGISNIIGHPLKDEGEFFADTVTVLLNFPNSFMYSVDALEKPQDRELICDVARANINLLRKYADDPRKADALFSRELLEFIRL